MEYPIYTYGGGELLVSIFNAIAAIFKSDNNYLTPVGSVALTLGGIYIGTKAIFKGDIALLSNNWLLPSFIVFILLFSPKSTVWVKDDVVGSAAVKIDNIPIGISFFTSLASVVSHKVSKMLEETMLPVDIKTSHTGLIYGSKAIAKLRDIQIQDPVLLKNVKEYMRQCYMKPYIIGNFGGHRAAAIRATDILGYLEQNPVKVFGVRWYEGGDLSSKFMTCTDAGRIAKKELEAHSRDSYLMSKFGAALGVYASDQNRINATIKSMVSDTLKVLEQSQLEVHEWMKQAMVLNANRESYDDWREKVGHSRVFPELVKMQATRGMFHQGLGSIVGAEMSEGLLPVAAQPVMLALVMMCFVIVLPLALLPGGWSYILTGIKLMIWVCSWPVFYTVIHSIAMIQLKHALGGWGEDGLSLIGQGGFTELILIKYSTVQGLVTSVPFISFAIVFGSPYALSSIAGSIAGVGSAASIGASVADANLSMNQTSIGNSTKYQRQEMPTLTMGGGVIDDGVMRVLSDSSGNQLITEHQDQMAVNYKGSEAFTGQTSTSLANAKSDMGSIRASKVLQESVVNSEGFDFARSFVDGKVTSDSVSTSSLETLRNTIGSGSSTTKSDSVSDSKSSGTNSHLGMTVPGAITAVTGVTAGTGTTASNINEVRESLDAQERQSFDKAMEEVYQASKTGSFTANSSEEAKLGSSLGANLTKLEQISKEEARMQQDIDTYTEQLSYLQTNSGSIDRNINDQVIKEVMHEHPELRSKEQAARWMKSNREEADAIARPIIDASNPFKAASTSSKVEALQKNTQAAGNMEILLLGSLDQKHKDNIAKLKEEAVVTDATGVKKSLNEAVSDKVNAASKLYNNKGAKDILYDSLGEVDQRTFTELSNSKDDEESAHNKNKAAINLVKENTYNSTINRAAMLAGKNVEELSEDIDKSGAPLYGVTGPLKLIKKFKTNQGNNNDS